MRILFITATRVGDAVLSTGLLDRLLAEHPGARVTIACGPAAASLFRAVPGLERIVVLDKMAFSLHWVLLWASCGRRLWDVVVDLRNSPLTLLIPARRRYRFAGARGSGHRVERLAQVLGVAGDSPTPRLWTDDGSRAQARRLIADGTPVLAIGPTANWPAKQWRGENFAELVRRLAGPGGIMPGARIAVFGRADERPGVLGLLDAIPAERRLDLVGSLDLLTVFACLERSSFYVGNDSGLMHLAAAAGIPTLGLFGPSPDEHYAPWGPLCAVVRSRLGLDEIFPEGFDHRNTGTLMDSLSVDDAEAAARALWRRAREAAA